MIEDFSKLQLVDYPKFDDDRGSFIPTPLSSAWLQENLSFSKKGVLRGMHLQTGADAQSKLVRVLVGKAIDVVIDLRPDSPDFKKVSSFMLDPADANYLFVPRGFAHGFLALEGNTLFQYRVDNGYAPESEQSIHWKTVADAFLPVAEQHGLREEDLLVNEKDVEAPMLDAWLKMGLAVA